MVDLVLHVLDCVAGLHVECDGLASQGLDEDLHGCVLCVVCLLVLCRRRVSEVGVRLA